MNLVWDGLMSAFVNFRTPLRWPLRRCRSYSLSVEWVAISIFDIQSTAVYCKIDPENIWVRGISNHTFPYERNNMVPEWETPEDHPSPESLVTLLAIGSTDEPVKQWREG